MRSDDDPAIYVGSLVVAFIAGVLTGFLLFLDIHEGWKDDTRQEQIEESPAPSNESVWPGV